MDATRSLETGGTRGRGEPPGRGRIGRRRPRLGSGLLALALGAPTLLAGVAAQARPPGEGWCGGRGHGHGHGIERIERRVPRLELPPETEKAVYAAIDEARAAHRALERDLRAAHERLRSQLDRDPPALDEVLAQADSLGSLRTEMRKADLRAMVAVRSLLSAQQWEELHERRHGPPRDGDAGAAR